MIGKQIKGFTLIELMIVVCIVCILCSIALGGHKDRAKHQNQKQAIDQQSIPPSGNEKE